MSTNCIHIDAYDCGPIVHTEVTRRAAKPYECGECGDAIAKGDLYEYFRGLFEDFWSTHRTCARCVLVRSDFFRGWIYGEMVENFQDTHGFDYRDGIPTDFTPCGQEDKR